MLACGIVIAQFVSLIFILSHTYISIFEVYDTEVMYLSDYYLDGEERFGPVSSFLYSIGTRLCRMRGLYAFVISDLKGAVWDELLDVGTGPGELPLVISKSFESKRIYAVDPSEPMLRIARRRCDGTNVSIVLGSSRKVPFRRKFDIIISSLSFHHWEEREKSLKYLAGLLKRGGQIRIYEFERRELTGIMRIFVSTHAVTRKEMIDVAKSSGLKMRGIVQRNGYIMAAMSK